MNMYGDLVMDSVPDKVKCSIHSLFKRVEWNVSVYFIDLILNEPSRSEQDRLADVSMIGGQGQFEHQLKQ